MENNAQEPLEVGAAAQGSPESPEPSLQSPLPVFQMPAGDAASFMGFYSADDIDDLEYWAKRSRDLRRVSGSFAEDPEISDNLKFFKKTYSRPSMAIQAYSSCRRGADIPAAGVSERIRLTDPV